MYYQGVLIGVLSFVIIGVFHPVVIKAEFYLGKKSWVWFLIVGLLFCVASLFIRSVLLSALTGLVGFSCLWSIKEMIEQEARVQKGWFPPNPKRKGAIEVRREEERDYDSIRRINEQAFGQLDEAFLVEKLRSHPAFEEAISLVAVKSNIVVGHVLFFPVKLVEGTNERSVFCLAPLAVFPQFHSQGIGSALVRKGLEMISTKAYTTVVVQGEEAYYSRFGFEPASSYDVTSSLSGTSEALMVLELSQEESVAMKGRVEYPKEFTIFI